MKTLSITIFEFENMFKTNEDCIEYLTQVRWPEGFICPRCELSNYGKLSASLYQCKICRKQTSVTSGTIFHKTHIPLYIWFRVIYMVAEDKGGTSSTRIAKQFGIQQKSSWLMLHKIRAAMQARNELTKLEGVIELDQAFFNTEARKYQPEPKTETKIVVLAEERNNHAGRLQVQLCREATSANIRRTVLETTKSGIKHKFKTDGWKAHWVLPRMGHDADIQALPGAEGSKKLPWVHTFVSLMRRFLVGTYHGVSPKLLLLYLDEFVFRANRRFNQCGIWPSLVRACVFAQPVTFAELNG
jgi:transposase-like protein